VFEKLSMTGPEPAAIRFTLEYAAKQFELKLQKKKYVPKKLTKQLHNYFRDML